MMPVLAPDRPLAYRIEATLSGHWISSKSIFDSALGKGVGIILYLVRKVLSATHR